MIAETTALDKWGYLVGVGILLLIWLILYLLRRDLHRRMLVMSISLVPLAPLGQFYFLQDYWHPPIILPVILFGHTFGGAADLLFAFAMGGLATAIYPVLTHRYPQPGLHRPLRWVVLAFVLLEGGSVIVLTTLLHVNSIFSSIIGFALTAISILIVRRDLAFSAVVSAIMSGLALTGAEGVLSFVTPLYLSRYWLLYHTSWGILIVGRVPLTEALWGMSFGLVTGILYDAFEGLTLVPKRSASKPTSSDKN